MELFPGTFIGIGGDECPKDQWRHDPRTQELMRERGLADEDELQAWFIGRLDERITARGRRLLRLGRDPGGRRTPPARRSRPGAA